MTHKILVSTFPFYLSAIYWEILEKPEILTQSENAVFIPHSPWIVRWPPVYRQIPSYTSFHELWRHVQGVPHNALCLLIFNSYSLDASGRGRFLFALNFQHYTQCPEADKTHETKRWWMIQQFNILVSEFQHVCSLQRQRNWYSVNFIDLLGNTRKAEGRICYISSLGSHRSTGQVDWVYVHKSRAFSASSFNFSFAFIAWVQTIMTFS